MINVSIAKDDRNISISFDCRGDLFTAVKAYLKINNLHWNPSSTSWECSVFKFDEIRAGLEEYDIVHVFADEKLLAKLRSGESEQIISKERIVTDYSLLNHLPIKGKAPYENFQRVDIASGLSRNRYGFFLGMGCLTGETKLTCRRSGGTFTISLKELYERFNGLHHGPARKWDLEKPTYVRSLLKDYFGPNKIEAVTYSGEKLVFELMLESGKSLKLTSDHKILTPAGWRMLCELQAGDEVLTNGIPICKRCGGTEKVSTNPKLKHYGYCQKCSHQLRNYQRLDNAYYARRKGDDGYIYLRGEVAEGHPRNFSSGLLEHIYIAEKMIGRTLHNDEQVHHINHVRDDNRPENLQVVTIKEHAQLHNVPAHFHKDFRRSSGAEIIMVPKVDKVLSIKELGIEDTYDISCEAPYHNFIANGIVVHNSGKSYIASALIAHYYLKWGKVGKIVIVTTSIGVRNLYHEFFKFIKDLPACKVAIADTSNREPFHRETDIVIMSYNSFRLVCNQSKKVNKLTATKPRKPFLPLEEWAASSVINKDMMLILDESHNIAIPDSQQSHLIALHSPAFKYRYLFTGTPADKPEKLYNQLKTLDPALTHRLSYTDWLEEYAEIGTRFSRFDVRSWKKHKLEELNKQVTASYAIYRNSEDILDLPAHYIKKIYLNMGKQHRKIYEAFVVSVLDELHERGDSSTRDIVNKFPYMLLAVENPFLLEKHVDKFDDKLASSVLNFKEEYMEKISILEDILDEQKEEKGVVWVVHPKTAEILAEHFKSLNPIVITGATDATVRNDLLEEFRTNDKARILIANIQVLNTSVTITWATWQCYMERIFGYSPYEQSTKRIYRIGQNKPVTTYIPIYNNSLDILLDRNLDSKDTLVKGLMSKDFLSQDEWNKIFNFAEDSELPLN